MELLNMVKATIEFFGLRNQSYIAQAREVANTNIGRIRGFEKIDPAFRARNDAAVAALQRHTREMAEAATTFLAALILPKAERDAKAEAMKEQDGSALNKLRACIRQDDVDAMVSEIAAAVPIQADPELVRYHAGVLRCVARVHAVNGHATLKFMEDIFDAFVHTFDGLPEDTQGLDEARAAVRDAVAGLTKPWADMEFGVAGSEPADAPWSKSIADIVAGLKGIAAGVGVTPEKAAYIGSVLGSAVMLPPALIQPLVTALIESDCDVEAMQERMRDPENMGMGSVVTMMLCRRIEHTFDTETEYWGDSADDAELRLRHEAAELTSQSQRIAGKLAELQGELKPREDELAQEQASATPDIAKLAELGDSVKFLKARIAKGNELAAGAAQKLAQVQAQLTEFGTDPETAGVGAAPAQS